MFFNIVKFLWFGNEGKLFLIFFYLFILFRNYWAQLLVHRISIGVLGREIVLRQLMLLLNKFQALLLRNLAFSVSNGHSRTGFSEYSKPFFSLSLSYLRSTNRAFWGHWVKKGNFTPSKMSILAYLAYFEHFYELEYHFLWPMKSPWMKKWFFFIPGASNLTMERIS